MKEKLFEKIWKQQELSTEVVNVDTVRSLVDRHWDQQFDVCRLRKLKKRTQGSSVSCEKLIAVQRREIRRAVPAVHKGNMCKRPGSKSSASVTPQRRMRPEFNIGTDDRVSRKQLKLTIERTSNRIIRKPIKTKATKQIIRPREVEDWTFCKVWPPPKRKKMQKTAGEPESLETSRHSETLTVWFSSY
jgi:hypothetical protein